MEAAGRTTLLESVLPSRHSVKKDDTKLCLLKSQYCGGSRGE
jgi:hypothetical protein